MEENRAELLERVLTVYGNWYNIDRKDEAEAPLVASGVFDEHGEAFMLIKKAKMWTADRHEYTFFFSVPHLDTACYEACLAKARELGEPMVKPGPNHMCSYVVMVILCDDADEAALAALKKCRIRKSFQFSLQGWMEVHTAAIEVGKASVTANSDGYHTAKFLKKIVCPEKQTKGILPWKKR